MALIFRKEAVTRLPCFATPPQFRSIHARKVWQIYVRRFDARITISTRPRAVPKTGPNIQIFVKRRGNWPKSVAHATRLPDFVLVQGISIANEITGTYRSGIRPDGLLGFGLVTSRPRSLCSLDDDQTRKRVLRANVFAAALFRPRNFDRLPDRRRATRSFSSFSFQFRKISFQYRVISFLLYTQYSHSLFLLCFIQGKFEFSRRGYVNLNTRA